MKRNDMMRMNEDDDDMIFYNESFIEEEMDSSGLGYHRSEEDIYLD